MTLHTAVSGSLASRTLFCFSALATNSARSNSNGANIKPTSLLFFYPLTRSALDELAGFCPAVWAVAQWKARCCYKYISRVCQKEIWRPYTLRRLSPATHSLAWPCTQGLFRYVRSSLSANAEVTMHRVAKTSKEFEDKEDRQLCTRLELKMSICMLLPLSSAQADEEMSLAVRHSLPPALLLKESGWSATRTRRC